MVKLLFFLFPGILCLTSTAYAQEAPPPDAPSQPVRLELESWTESDWSELIILPDSSVLLCLNKSPYRYSKDPYQFTKYNSRLAPVWDKTFEMPPGAEYVQSYAEGPFVYFLFLGSKSTEYHILRILISSGKAILTHHKKVPEVEFTGFKAMGDHVFITGLDNQHLTVLHLDLVSNQSKILPAVYDQLSALADFRIDTLTRHAEFVLSESNRQRSRLTVKRISPEGELVNTHFVLPQQEKNLLSAQLAPGDIAGKLMAGTYIEREFKFAQGLFSHTLGGNIHFYDFKTFTRFFDYMSKRRQRNIQRRIERFEAKRKELRLRYKLLLHDIYPYDGGYILVAEAYTPQYNAETNLYAIRGIAMGAFEGYRFSHAIVCAFDREGNLLWDNSYPLKNVVNHQLDTNVQVGFAEDRIILTYADEEDIHYKIVDRDRETPNDLKVPVLTYSEEEKVSSPSYENIVHWYGTDFLAFGFHRVRSPSEPMRTVFYLNKLSF